MRFTKDGRVSSCGTDRVFRLELQDRFVLSTCFAVVHMPHVTVSAHHLAGKLCALSASLLLLPASLQCHVHFLRSCSQRMAILPISPDLAHATAAMTASPGKKSENPLCVAQCLLFLFLSWTTCAVHEGWRSLLKRDRQSLPASAARKVCFEYMLCCRAHVTVTVHVASFAHCVHVYYLFLPLRSAVFTFFDPVHKGWPLSRSCRTWPGRQQQ